MPQEALFFSIIVATHGRPRQLGRCLQSLAGTDYPRERFEVIVVDDGSPSPLGKVVAPYRELLRLTLLVQAQAGPGMARNHGVAEARGTNLAFTDDDCMPEPDWLERLAGRLSACPGCVVGGRTANALHDNPYAAASQLLQDYLYAYYNLDPHHARFFASNNLALPAERFRTLGGFGAAYTRTAAEDRDLCDRCLQAGYPMVYAPEAIVYHAHDLTLATFWRQHFTYGCGAHVFHHMHALRNGRRVNLEPPTFYAGLVAAPFALRRRPRLRLAALLALSQVANAAGYLKETVRRRAAAPA